MISHADLLDRYKQLRQIGLKLNNQLTKHLPRNSFGEGAKTLGMLRGKNKIELDTDDEIAVLADFCLHDVRQNGLNTIDRYLIECPPAPGSEEDLILRAKQQAWYSLLAVEDRELGVGVHVVDLLRDEALFLVDVGFSRTASAGFVLATRIMTIEDMTMTTGAALPVGTLSQVEQTEFVRRMKAALPKLDFAKMSLEDEGRLAASLIRACLRQGAAERIRYVTPGEDLQPAGNIHSQTTPRVGRNDPCPCGSGLKFKRCCGGRR